MTVIVIENQEKRRKGEHGLVQGIYDIKFVICDYIDYFKKKEYKVKKETGTIQF